MKFLRVLLRLFVLLVIVAIVASVIATVKTASQDKPVTLAEWPDIARNESA